MRRTIDNCKMHKKTNFLPEKQGDKCLGYGKAYGDDEPCETCKKCRLCTAFEEED